MLLLERILMVTKKRKTVNYITSYLSPQSFNLLEKTLLGFL